MCMCNSRDEWYTSDVTMHTFVNISRCLIISCFVMLATDTSYQTTNKPCVDLQLTSGSEDGMVQANEDGDVHITFVVSDNCTGSSSRALVKLSTQGADLLVDFCTVYFQNNTCNVTDKPIGHHCINTNHSQCSISWKVQTTDKLLKLRLTNIITKEEKVISLNITGSAKKKQGTPEIIGICCGIVVAVITAAVIIKKYIFKGSCARQLQIQVKEDRQTTSSNVGASQSRRNTWSSSGRQAQEDTQVRPSSLDHPGSQQQLVNHQNKSSIPAIPKRKRRIYDHIVQPSVTTTRTVEDAYSHIQPSTHKPLSRQKAVNSYNPDAIATKGKTQKHRHAPLARNVVIRREAELYNHSTSFATTTGRSKREVLSHTSPNPSNDSFTRNPGQLQIHNTSSSLKELRSPEQLYNHAIPSRMSVGSSPSDSGCLTIVQFKTVPPIKQEQLCNNNPLSSCTVARSLDQLYNHIGSSSSPRSERDKQNPTTQRPYSVGQEPVQSERTLYDQAVLPTNYRRQVVCSMYDYVSY
ncbi:uncharacterized protein LOC112569139 isoform X1 [Pomacea canaliculata]|uniref:uncharacterized protein LOC112569139 isoform X1 n=1 Tax=Pomacea canaliculata TaxID=400727 RepID=UPI000D72D6E7|nr:uncharacterized protein LOC112569139 isoform X1 [Pomacea canaliculata]